jgi:hypothetical protein
MHGVQRQVLRHQLLELNAAFVVAGGVSERLEHFMYRRRDMPRFQLVSCSRNAAVHPKLRREHLAADLRGPLRSGIAEASAGQTRRVSRNL